MKKVFAKTIFKVDSAVSGNISVRDNGTVRELFVKGTKQTSWSEDEAVFEGTYWKAAVSIPFSLPSQSPQFLVVGLGGGTIPKLLTKRYPESDITAIEIDPIITTIAKDFFALKNYQNIKVIQANANSWIARNYKKYHQHFDAIFLDAFFGEVFALDTQIKTVQKLHHMLKENGLLVTNRIYNEYEKKVDEFIIQLSDLFSEQTTHIIEGYSGNDNIVIYSKKTPSSN